MESTLLEDSPDTSLRDASERDAQGIADIYNHYVRETIVTFEEEEVAPTEIAARLRDTNAAKLPWLVAEREGRILGYAYASRWNGRCAYRFSVEATVYLAPDATGGGVGSQLYKALFEELRQRAFHTVIGGISLPNPASVALHEKMGMTKVAHFSEVGYKFGQWIDVGYWQGVLDA